MLAWVAKNHEEAAAARPLRYSTTQSLHQGTGNAEKTKPERLIKMERKVAGSIPERTSFGSFSP